MGFLFSVNTWMVQLKFHCFCFTCFLFWRWGSQKTEENLQERFLMAGCCWFCLSNSCVKGYAVQIHQISGHEIQLVGVMSENSEFASMCIDYGLLHATCHPAWSYHQFLTSPPAGQHNGFIWQPTINLANKFFLSPGGVWSIVMRMSVCMSAARITQ